MEKSSAKITDYKELAVWKKSRDFVKRIYEATASFPSEERYGITSQLRRAIISIPANIAEGYARQSRKEYIQFISIAYGSAIEVETLLILACDLKLLSRGNFESLMEEFKELLRMLNKLRLRLKETA